MAESQPEPGGGPGTVQRPETASPVETQWEDWRIALQPIPGIVAWYRKHKISGALLLAAFVIVKGYVLARGDITSALAIVQYAGVIGWAAAALLSSLPLLAAAMLAIACYQLLWPLSGVRLANLEQQLSVAAVAFVICAVLTPWWFAAGAVALGLLFGGLQWAIYGMDRWENRFAADWITWFGRLAISAASVSAVIAMLYAAWLPDEIVTFKRDTVTGEPLVSGEPLRWVSVPASVQKNLPAAVAHVLAEGSGGRITLLDSSTRRIARHKDKNVETITECHFTPHGGFSDITQAPTLWAEVAHGPLYRFRPAHSTPCPDKATAGPSMFDIISPFVIVAAVATIIAEYLRRRGPRGARIPVARPYGHLPGGGVSTAAYRGSHEAAQHALISLAGSELMKKPLPLPPSRLPEPDNDEVQLMRHAAEALNVFVAVYDRYSCQGWGKQANPPAGG